MRLVAAIALALSLGSMAQAADVTNGGIPIGPAGGDLSSTYPNPTVSAVGGHLFSIGGSGGLTFTLTGPTTVTLPTSGTVTALGNTVTGSGGTLVEATGPVLVTPTLGVASGTSMYVTGAGTAPVVTSPSIQLWGNSGGGAPTISITDSARTVNNRDSSIYSQGGVTHFAFVSDNFGAATDFISATGGQAAGLTAMTLLSGTATLTFSSTVYDSCTALTTNASGLLGCTASDARLKNDLGKISPDQGLAFVLGEASPHRYTFKDGYGPAGVHAGMFAQDVIAAGEGELVHVGIPTELTPDGELQYNQTEQVAYLIAAVKALASCKLAVAGHCWWN